jgi:hypothetical protein
LKKEKGQGGQYTIMPMRHTGMGTMGGVFNGFGYGDATLVSVQEVRQISHFKFSHNVIQDNKHDDA